MTIKVTEVGKIFYYATAFDLSGNTELTLKFTSPTAAEFTITKTGGRVTAPVVAGDLDGLPPADTYMQIATIATDFTEFGTWTVRGTYTDGTPKVYHGNAATFTVEAL